MDYSNPKIPEGINYSREHPLKEFALLTLGILGSIIVIIVILGIFVDRLANYIPYRYESIIPINKLIGPTQDGKMATYLQNLADKLAAQMELPKEMKLSVHYVDSNTVNAFATLNGNVVFFRGLLDKLHSENELAMVMAHEIAHIKYRHPIRSMGSGIVIGILLSVAGIAVDSDVVSDLVSTSSNLTQLKFSRRHETEADRSAIETVIRVYGHLNGTEDLFEELEKQQAKHAPPEFFNTHPDTDNRIQMIHQAEQQRGLATDGALTALPKQFNDWLKVEQNDNKKNVPGD